MDSTQFDSLVKSFGSATSRRGVMRGVAATALGALGLGVSRAAGKHRHKVHAAASPHFVGNVSFRDLGTTLQASGSIAGLGNANIDVQLQATGTASVVCINPGGNRAPGQDTTVNVSGTVSNLEVKNGRVDFSVTTTAPTVTSAACPNAQWTAQVTDVSFTSAAVTVIQPAGSGNVVLTETFSV